MKLKDRLAELRRSRGYSLRDLRERIDERTGEKMAVSYLSALERVERTPSIETLTRIAAGYGMTLQELLAPVGSDEANQVSRYSDSLEKFAEARGLNDVDKEALSRIEYRGHRPETEAEWDAILSVLKLLPNRRTGG